MGGAMGAACFFHRREEGVLTHAREEPKAIQRTGVGQLTTASMPRRASFAECSETFEKIQTLAGRPALHFFPLSSSRGALPLKFPRE